MHGGFTCSPSTPLLRRCRPGPCSSTVGSCSGFNAAHSSRFCLAPKRLSHSLTPKPGCYSKSRGSAASSPGAGSAPAPSCSSSEQRNLLDSRRRSSSACSSSYSQQPCARANPAVRNGSGVCPSTASPKHQDNKPAAAQCAPSATPSAAAAAAVGGTDLHQHHGRLRPRKLGPSVSAQQWSGFNISHPPCPWGLAGAGGLPLPLRHQKSHLLSSDSRVNSSRRHAVRLGAFMGTAAATSSTPWHQAVG